MNTVLLDGAIGTTLWNMANETGAVWRFNVEKPDIVFRLHKEYIDAGSKIICTNTFDANRFALAKSDYELRDIIKAGVKIAKKASENTDVKVSLDIGTLPVLLEPYGDLSEEEAFDIYKEILDAGMEENPDMITLETFMDVELLKIAVKAASLYNKPIFCSMSFEASGRTIMGNRPTDMIEGLKDFNINAIGLNCSLEPELSFEILKVFSENTDLPLIFKPNAGKPQYVDGKTTSKTDEEIFANDMLRALELNRDIYMGGCCGTSPTYINKLRENIKK